MTRDLTKTQKELENIKDKVIQQTNNNPSNSSSQHSNHSQHHIVAQHQVSSVTSSSSAIPPPYQQHQAATSSSTTAPRLTPGPAFISEPIPSIPQQQTTDLAHQMNLIKLSHTRWSLYHRAALSSLSTAITDLIHNLSYAATTTTAHTTSNTTIISYSNSSSSLSSSSSSSANVKVYYDCMNMLSREAQKLNYQVSIHIYYSCNIQHIVYLFCIISLMLISFFLLYIDLCCRHPSAPLI